MNEQEEKALKNQVKDLVSRVEDLEGIKNPLTTTGRIDTLYEEVNRIDGLMADLILLTNSFIAEDIIYRTFKDEELVELYKQSGITFEEAKEFIEKQITKMETSAPLVSDYINGKIKDVLARSKLGKWIIYETVRRGKKKTK